MFFMSRDDAVWSRVWCHVVCHVPVVAYEDECACGEVFEDESRFRAVSRYLCWCYSCKMSTKILDDLWRSADIRWSEEFAWDSDISTECHFSWRTLDVVSPRRTIGSASYHDSW